MASRKSTLFVPVNAPSFDGRWHGRYPNGDKPPELNALAAGQVSSTAALSTQVRLGATAADVVAAVAAITTQKRLVAAATAQATATGALSSSASNDSTLLLYTDITAGPTSGGELDGGAYLSVFGFNLAILSAYGAIGTRTLTINGQPVLNYRAVVGAVGSGTGVRGTGVYESFGIQRLAVQVGALGSPTPGTELKLDIVDNTSQSLCANRRDASGFLLDFNSNRLSFINQPGPIVYVSLTGSDSNPGTFAQPLRKLQTYNSSAISWGGAVYGPWNGATQNNQIVPGTHIYIMGGEYGADFNTFDNRWATFARKTGTAPTGNAKSGPIVIAGYPGAVGANAPHDVTWTGVSGTAGAFNFADTSRSAESTPWSTVGYAKYIHICHLKVTTHPNSVSDAAPINHQTGADHARVVNCDLEWRCTSGSPLAAGIAGQGTSRRCYGNYIHDVYDPSGGQQNHGIYVDNNPNASGAARADYHGIYAWNCIRNTTGGQAIMARGLPSGSPADSAPYISVHHNWCEGFGKYGIEFFDLRGFGQIWGNIIIAGTTGLAGVYTDCDNVTVNGGIYVGFNTIIGWKTYAALYQHATTTTGYILYEGNVCYIPPGGAATEFGYFLNFGAPAVLNGNAYFNAGTGSITPPAADTNKVTTNPLFTNVAGKDFTPQAGSPLIAAAPVGQPTFAFELRDLYGLVRPQGSATRLTMGAIERPAA